MTVQKYGSKLRIMNIRDQPLPKQVLVNKLDYAP
jgi:hypothetical protein